MGSNISSIYASLELKKSRLEVSYINNILYCFSLSRSEHSLLEMNMRLQAPPRFLPIFNILPTKTEGLKTLYKKLTYICNLRIMTIEWM